MDFSHTFCCLCCSSLSHVFLRVSSSSSSVSRLHSPLPQRFSVEGLSTVIQNGFRQRFGSACSDRQVTSYFCWTWSFSSHFLYWKTTRHQPSLSWSPTKWFHLLCFSIWPRSSLTREKDALLPLRTSRSWPRVRFMFCTVTSWVSTTNWSAHSCVSAALQFFKLWEMTVTRCPAS